MDPLQSSEAVQQFMKLLEGNGRTGQAADLSVLIWYMDGIRQILKKYQAEIAAKSAPAPEKERKPREAEL